MKSGIIGVDEKNEANSTAPILDPLGQAIPPCGHHSVHLLTLYYNVKISDPDCTVALIIAGAATASSIAIEEGSANINAKSIVFRIFPPTDGPSIAMVRDCLQASVSSQ